jgi:hypothetical protein
MRWRVLGGGCPVPVPVPLPVPTRDWELDLASFYQEELDDCFIPGSLKR